MIRRLRERTAPGGLLHFGQGKWYPGEALPRWAFHCISRVDGVPVWENAALIAREDQDFGYGLADSLRFMTALSRRLQASAENILPAFDPRRRSAGPATGARRLHPAAASSSAGGGPRVVKPALVPKAGAACTFLW